MPKVDNAPISSATGVQTRRSALLAALYRAQEQYGYLSKEAIQRAAESVGVMPNQVYQMASFYSLYRREPVGQYLLQVCTGLSCHLRKGGDSIAAHITSKLGIEPGEMTADGRFTLKEVQCLASCGASPVMQVNDELYENLTLERVDEILDELTGA